MKNVRQRLTIAALAGFVLAEAILYGIFLSRDISHSGGTVWLKYGSVLLCLAVSWIYTARPRSTEWTVGCALIFTALADLFLLVLDDRYVVGVLSFCVAQGFYFARIRNMFGDWRRAWITVAVRLGVFAAALIVLWRLGMLTALNGITAFYFVNLLANTVEAYVFAFRRDLRGLIFAVGLTLFCACDVCVGLNNLDVGIDAARFVSVAMWAFYLPSQVLIVLSRFCMTQKECSV